MEQTTVMLNHFGKYASKLRTLRICFHAQLYEGHCSEAALIGGIKDYLPRLSALEVLELHINSRADFSGAEIICAIPDSLKRLYVSDKLISPERLEELITKRYLWSDTKIGQGDFLETLVVNGNEGESIASQNAGLRNAGFIQATVRKKVYYPRRLLETV